MDGVKRETAEQLVAQYLAFGELFNRLTELSYEIDEEADRKAVRSLSADATFSLYEIVRIVGREYPDLVPKD